VSLVRYSINLIAIALISNVEFEQRCRRAWRPLPSRKYLAKYGGGAHPSSSLLSSNKTFEINYVNIILLIILKFEDRNSGKISKIMLLPNEQPPLQFQFLHS
jgi:hypothetical protein